MRTIVKDSTPPLNEPEKYPVLKKAAGSGFIVLFINLHSGTVVGNPTGGAELGKYNTNWIRCTDKVHWVDFKGSVELCNP